MERRSDLHNIFQLLLECTLRLLLRLFAPPLVGGASSRVDPEVCMRAEPMFGNRIGLKVGKKPLEAALMGARSRHLGNIIM